jgi:predicted amidohydrolase YtcJ
MIGQERMRRSSPHRLLLDEGITVAFGSDGIPFSPLYGIGCALNHPIEESRITLEEAVKCYTLNGAIASFDENQKGSVEAGKLADLTILGGDLTEVPQGKISDVPVSMAIVNGEILYRN